MTVEEVDKTVVIFIEIRVTTGDYFLFRLTALNRDNNKYRRIEILIRVPKNPDHS